MRAQILVCAWGWRLLCGICLAASIIIHGVDRQSAALAADPEAHDSQGFNQADRVVSAFRRPSTRELRLARSQHKGSGQLPLDVAGDLLSDDLLSADPTDHDGAIQTEPSVADLESESTIGSGPAEVNGDFPSLPPDPYAAEEQDIPSLEDELWLHGGSYLYCAEGDRTNWPSDDQSHHEYLRLPSNWQAPEPFTAFADFLGADPIKLNDHTWHGPGGYSWEPRFVGYGSYELFGFALEQANRRQDVIGHQLLVELDLRLTGTERFHVQFRPLGRRFTGGSYYQFSDPDGYVNNSTGEPDRYWFEGEIHSLGGWCQDYFASNNTTVVAGKFPFYLHNTLLMNDDIVGAVISQNNIQWRNLSNLNLQLFVGANDVDTYANVESQVYGVNASIDYQRAFYEATYAHVAAELDRDTHYVGLSRTKFYGPLSVAGRALFKWGDRNGTGNSQLVTIESNLTRVFDNPRFGFEHGVFFCNAFWAAEGWNSIGGGNFNRLRTAFEVDPLVRLAAGPARQDTVGIAAGVQLFRHHEDESLIPEFAWEQPGGDPVFGVGLRYQRKTGPRTFLEVFCISNWSDNEDFDRDGVFLSHTWFY